MILRVHDFTIYGFVILRSCNFVKLQFYDYDMSQFQEGASFRLPYFRNWTGPHRNVPVLHACTCRRRAPLRSSQAATPLSLSMWFSFRYPGVGEKLKLNVDGLPLRVPG